MIVSYHLFVWVELRDDLHWFFPISTSFKGANKHIVFILERYLSASHLHFVENMWQEIVNRNFSNYLKECALAVLSDYKTGKSSEGP